MKAIRKSDGAEIDVVIFHEKEYIETYKEGKDPQFRNIYRDFDLVVEEPEDWESLRRQYAGMFMQAYLMNPFCKNVMKESSNQGKNIETILAHSAVVYADALIEELKKPTGNRNAEDASNP